MPTRKLHVPAFRDESTQLDGTAAPGVATVEEFNSVVVVRWGRVAGFTFRAGDRLVLRYGERADGLLLLRPRGYGWPMLGRMVGTRLIAEPGGVRAAPQRWRVAARVVGVERRLGRSVTDHGRWYVAVAPRGTTTDSALSEAGFTSGWLSAPEVDALCHRAARWMDEGRGALAVGVGLTADASQRLVADCSAGRLRTEAKVPEATDTPATGQAEVLVGPWVPAPRPVEGPAAFTTADGVRYDAPQPLRPEVEPAAQLSLFHAKRSHRAS